MPSPYSIDLRERVVAACRDTLATLDPHDLAFVDESGVDTRLVRRYARAPQGQRAVGTAPVRYERLTVVGALTTAGLVAPQTSAQAMTSAGAWRIWTTG